MSKATIEILGKSYQIPDMSASIKPLQDNIHENVALVRLGERPKQEVKKVVKKSGFLGLWSSKREIVEVIPARTLSVEERFERLGHLVTSYNDLLRELTRNKEVYTSLLSQIEDGSLKMVRSSLERQHEVVARLSEQARRIQAKGKDDLLRKNQEQQERVGEAVQVTIKAGLLIVSKIEVCRKGILALVEDQNKQLELLEKMREDLGLTLEVYMMDKEVEAVVEQAQELAQVAIEFDSYLKEYMGPLHDLLSEVGRVDESVARTIHQVESLTASLEQGSSLGAVSLEASYEPVLELLVQGNLRQDQVKRLIDDVRKKDIKDVTIDAGLLTGEGSLEQAIINASLFFSTSEVQAEEPRRASADPTPPPSTPAPDAPSGFVLLPAGSFMMGSADGGHVDEEPVHWVKLTYPFWVGISPVTQQEWEVVMGSNPSFYQGRLKPVTNVNWFDAITFCNARSRREGLEECYEVYNARGIPGSGGDFEYGYVRWKGHGASGYRLLTEAEWEYACRAGHEKERYGVLDESAWHLGNSNDETHGVCLKHPNDWGLYDMIGNVWEWVWDWYDEDYYQNAPKHDPYGPEEGNERVLRGASKSLSSRHQRAGYRYSASPHQSGNALGFRCARSV